MALIIIFFTDLAIKLIYLPFFYYRHSTTGVVIGVVDGLAYLLKSLEIGAGNFMPIRTHGMGLSLLTAPIFKLLGSSSIFVNMVYAHFINIFISSLCIFPLYFIAKRIFSDKKYIYLTLVLFTLSFWWLYGSIGFFAEPLFTLILLTMLLLIMKADDNPRWLLPATILAGLGYWVKPTGILFPIIILISLFLPLLRTPTKSQVKQSLKQAVAIIAVFLAITAPTLGQGYGENSRYFLDDYNQVWGQKYESVSFIEYLKNHNFTDYLSKFIFFGLGGLIFSLFAIALPYSIFSIWGMLLVIARPPPRNLSLLLITIAVWIIGLTPVYQVYFTPRHLFPLIPLMALFAAYAISVIANPKLSTASETIPPFLKGVKGGFRSSVSGLLAITTTAITLLFFAAGFIYPQYYFINPRSQQEMEFARWVAFNLRGKLAISIEGDFVMMNLPDATIANRGLFDIITPQSGLELVYPGYFTDPQELKKWMMKNNTKYVALTRGNQKQRIIVPPIIYEGELPSEDFKKIQTVSDRQLNWQIDIYELK